MRSRRRYAWEAFYCIAVCYKLINPQANHDNIRRTHKLFPNFFSTNSVKSAHTHVRRTHAHTQAGHVPFRDSKLTHLLQDSLSRDNKALMITQISPTDDDVSETMCTLQFASRVKGVELGAAKKHKSSKHSKSERKKSHKKKHKKV